MKKPPPPHSAAAHQAITTVLVLLTVAGGHRPELVAPILDDRSQHRRIRNRRGRR